MLPGVLCWGFGVWTDKRDGIASDLPDVRFEHRMGDDFEEGDVLGPELLHDLVERSSEQDRLADVVPAVLGVEIALEPFTFNGRHNLCDRRASGSQSFAYKVLEQLLLRLHERRMECATYTELRGKHFVRRVSSDSLAFCTPTPSAIIPPFPSASVIAAARAIAMPTAVPQS